MCELHRVGQRSHLEVELRRLGFTLGLNLKHETLFLFKLLDSYLMQIHFFFPFTKRLKVYKSKPFSGLLNRSL